MRALIVSVAALAYGCPPSPLPPAPDAEPAKLDASLDAGVTVYQRACSNLASLSCAEGAASNCVTTMTHAQNERLVNMKPACLAEAKTKAEARACGSVACP